MKQIKILGVLAVALTLGLSACNNGGGKSSVEECKKHTWGEYTTVKAATCTEDGSQKRVCSVCGKEETKVIKAGHTWGEYVTKTDSTCTAEGVKERECSVCHTKETAKIAKKDHELIADTSKQDVAPTCEEDGTKYLKCKNCDHTEEQVDPKLGHLYAKDEDGNDIVEWTKEATCTEAGVGSKACTREGCDHVEPVTAEALGHDIQLVDDQGEPEAGKAKVRLYKCSRCEITYLGFKANEVTDKSKATLVIGTDGGARFFGHPIGNDVPLNENGDPSENNHPSIFNKNQEGDLFEYVFDLTAAQAAELASCRLYCDAKPAQYLGANGIDFWANKSGDTDWTRGRYIDDAEEHLDFETNDDGSFKLDDQGQKIPVMVDVLGEDGQPTGEKVQQGKEITDYRYVLYVDGKIQQFDSSIKVRVPQGDPRGEYVMPFTFHLHEGTNTISLRMAGGYRSQFYNFTFRPYEEEQVEPAHVHAFANETKVDKKGEGYVDYYTAVCAEDNAKRIRIAAMDGSFVGESKNKTGNSAPLDGYMKLSGNGEAISYKFDWDGGVKTAKLYQYGYMDNFSSNGNRTYTSQNGGSLGDNGCNFGVNFNSAEVEITAETKAITYDEFFEGATVSPGGNGNSNLAACYIGSVSLANGDNTFTFTRYNSFNLSVSDFWLVIE